MAYDLLLRRQLDRDYSRGEGSACQAGPRLAAVAGLGLLLSALAAPRAGRQLERRYYRRAYRGDLRATQETPAITMRELVYGPR